MKKIVLVISMFISFSHTTFAVQGAEGGGGGNTLGGKLIESYIRDIHDFKEYKEVIEPLIKKVKDRNKGLAAFLEYGFEDTVWYFIPHNLTEQSSKITGIPFSSDQVAVPNPITSEIWVDETQFISMPNDKERAKLLSHEAFLHSYNKMLIILNRRVSSGFTDVVTELANKRMKITRLITNFLFNENNYSLDNDSYNHKLSKIISVERNGQDWDVPCLWLERQVNSIEFCSAWLK